MGVFLVFGVFLWFVFGFVGCCLGGVRLLFCLGGLGCVGGVMAVFGYE